MSANQGVDKDQLEITKIGPDTSVRAQLFAGEAIIETVKGDPEGNGAPLSNALRREVRVDSDNPDRVKVESIDGDSLVGVFTDRFETAEVTIPIESSTGRSIIGAVERSLQGGLSKKEADQLNNLRAYIANHSGDGVLDAREQNTIAQRANNIAPKNSR